MAKKTFLVDLDLAKNELQNASIQNLSGAPSTDPEITDKGLVFYDTTMKKMRIWSGTKWDVVGADVGAQYVQNQDLAATVGNLPEFDSLNGTEIVDSGVAVSTVSTHMADTTSNRKHLKDNEADAMAASTADTPNKPSSSNKFATINDLSELGGGDMIKATYDTNNNGNVDTSDALISHEAASNPHSITPELIDALPLSGGTLSGDLYGTNAFMDNEIQCLKLGVNDAAETGYAVTVNGKSKFKDDIKVQGAASAAILKDSALNMTSDGSVNPYIYIGKTNQTPDTSCTVDVEGMKMFNMVTEGPVEYNYEGIRTAMGGLLTFNFNATGPAFEQLVHGIYPTEATHLATKEYVDSEIGNVPTDFLPLAGGLMDADSHIQFNSGIYPTRYGSSGIEWDNPGGITTIGNYGIVSKDYKIFAWDSSGKIALGGVTSTSYDINITGTTQITSDLDVDGTVDADVFSGPININRNTATAIHSNGGGELVLESETDIVLNAPTVAKETLVVMGDSTLNGFTEMNKDLSVLAKIYSMPTVAGDSDGVVTTKGYVDGLITGGVQFKGGYDASTNIVVGGVNDNTPLIGVSTKNVVHGDMYEVTVPGTPPGCTLALEIGDVAIANIDVAAGISIVCSNWTMVQKNLDVATEDTFGMIRVATDAEVMNGITTPASDEAAVTPEKLKLWKTEFQIAGSTQQSVGSGSLTANINTYPINAEEGYTIQITDDFGIEYQFEHTATDPTNVKLTANSNIPTGLTAKVVGSLVLNP